MKSFFKKYDLIFYALYIMAAMNVGATQVSKPSDLSVGVGLGCLLSGILVFVFLMIPSIKKHIT